MIRGLQNNKNIICYHLSLIDFDVIFPMQLSEFIKSLNFGSNVKKLQFSFFSNFSVIFHFLSKNLFSRIKKSLILNGIYSNRSKLDPSNETIRTQN